MGPGEREPVQATGEAADGPVMERQPPAVPVLQDLPAEVEPVSPAELNAWRRGFTPQAEIWNGRLAMVGLAVGLTVLLIARLSQS